MGRRKKQLSPEELRQQIMTSVDQHVTLISAAGTRDEIDSIRLQASGSIYGGTLSGLLTDIEGKELNSRIEQAAAAQLQEI